MKEMKTQKDTTETKKEQAILSVLALLSKRFEKKHKHLKSFTAHGRAYAVSCSTDCIVADAQLIRDVAKELLAEIRERGNYFEEFAAAKIVELLDLWLDTASRYAEFDKYYPKASKGLISLIPTLGMLSQEGAATWEKFHNKKNEKQD